eukprot:TRINITY_DN1360_c0_g1_i1.p1 TRINITY_DN1360_c0_g1~~TRINITY_DN1360_c0_g1_i1.p1  ORF type:complete len:269 (-),score=60.20 TRINITY_DN1360_c0_g1_i1:586-1392(-)
MASTLLQSLLLSAATPLRPKGGEPCSRLHHLIQPSGKHTNWLVKENSRASTNWISSAAIVRNPLMMLTSIPFRWIPLPRRIIILRASLQDSKEDEERRFQDLIQASHKAESEIRRWKIEHHQHQQLVGEGENEEEGATKANKDIHESSTQRSTDSATENIDDLWETAVEDNIIQEAETEGLKSALQEQLHSVQKEAASAIAGQLHDLQLELHATQNVVKDAVDSAVGKLEGVKARILPIHDAAAEKAAGAKVGVEEVAGGVKHGLETE